MNTIGVLSDTHMPKKGKVLPSIVIEHFQGVDHIVHAGDLTAPFVIAELEKLAPVTAVAGNIDPPELAELLGWKKIMEFAGKRIGITHGHLGKGKSTPERAWNTFIGERVDVILFGHSHIPCVEKRDDIWLINPGSVTDKRRQPQHTFCLLHINHEIEIEWIRY